jgi:dihydrofolate reductase
VKIVSEKAGEFLRNLKNEVGKDIWLTGGGEFAESLVDEISLVVNLVFRDIYSRHQEKVIVGCAHAQ